MPVRQSPDRASGRLFIVATPIGNLADLTFRALEILKEVDVIACEDTRRTQKLLNHYRIKKRMLSYFQPQEQRKAGRILELLKAGKDVALVSDAGTPGISDPGYPLIRDALNEGISVHPVPGASAVTAALCAAGLPTHRFLFLGFPPPKPTAAANLLRSLREEPATLVFYLPARRLAPFLQQVAEILGQRRAVAARELTKLHEEFLRGTPEEIVVAVRDRAVRGEITLLIEGSSRRKTG
jgi:16S rRNA (cytidine1402-2'-O)-methyltransferase